MKNKKAQGLSIRTIIIALLALIVLVVLIAIFVNKIGEWGEDTGDVADTSQFGVGTVAKTGTCITADGGSGTCNNPCPQGQKSKMQAIQSKPDQRCAPGLFCCAAS